METLNSEVPQTVVRSMAVSLASPEAIYKGLVASKDEKPEVLQFYVAVKGSIDEPRYTLLGGKIEPSENVEEAIQREIGEEAGLRFLGLPKKTVIGQWEYASQKSGPRKVMVTYNPVLPEDAPVVGDPKIAGIRTIGLKDLRRLIEEGKLDQVPLESHLAIGGSGQDPIEISNEDSKKREKAMLKALDWMEHIENHLRVKFEGMIQASGGTQVTEDEFTAGYRRILSEFMRKGFEVGVREKISPNQKEGTEQSGLIDVLNAGYLGKDILYYLPELARHGVDWPGLEKATDGVRLFTKFLKGTYTDFLSQEQMTERDYDSWIKNEQTPLSQKIELINKLDGVMRNKLMTAFGVSDSDLEEVMGLIQNFYRDISNEMKIADPNLTHGLYQDFTLINEVNNAGYGALLSLFLGFDTKTNEPEAGQRIRFEAGRQLLLLTKALGGINHYHKEMVHVRNGRMEQVINNFFGGVVEERVVQLKRGNSMKVYVRKWGDQMVIVDERPVKTFASFLRKSFFERSEDIKDFLSVSVTFVDDVEDLNRTEAVIAELTDYLEKNFEGSVVSTHDRRSYGTEDYKQHKASEKRSVGGKRMGSQGSKFIRTKLFIELDEERLELTVYPIYSTEGKEGDYWGWLEKLGDDSDYVVRRLLAGEGGIPSLYDLLRPAKFYPYHYQHKLSAKYYN